MRFWTFDPNTCCFERASKQAALDAADVAVVNNDADVHVISDHQPPKRCPSGEPLVVAGVEFERELFE
jgi:hypothetical protein